MTNIFAIVTSTTVTNGCNNEVTSVDPTLTYQKFILNHCVLLREKNSPLPNNDRPSKKIP